MWNFPFFYNYLCIHILKTLSDNISEIIIVDPLNFKISYPKMNLYNGLDLIISFFFLDPNFLNPSNYKCKVIVRVAM